MKVEINYTNCGWDKVEGNVLYETRDYQVPSKGENVYVNNISYTVKTYYYYTTGCVDNHVKSRTF